MELKQVGTEEGNALATYDGKRFVDASPICGIACYELQEDGKTAIHKGVVGTKADAMRWLKYEKPRKLIKIHRRVNEKDKDL